MDRLDLNSSGYVRRCPAFFKKDFLVDWNVWLSPAHAQEISFWLNLERALLRIQEKRESVEVALTLDILKHGKRFHATVR